MCSKGGENIKKQKCWLCKDYVSELYDGAPDDGQGGVYCRVCLTCSVERLYDYNDMDISEVGYLKDQMKRNLVMGFGLVRVL
jgi:hypothetical protein